MQTIRYSNGLLLTESGVRTELTLAPSAITIGTFDGVHLGHRAIVSELVRKARQHGLRSVVITFEPHPKEVVGKTGEPVELLSTLAEKQSVLASLGVEVLLVIEFTKRFSLTTAEDFIEGFLITRIGLSEMVIGYDHGFGRDRQGTIETIRKLSARFGFGTDVVSEQVVSGTHLSSTAIRALLQAGEARRATELLGSPYSFSGTVVEGAKRGRSIGFPTANLRLDDDRKLLPKNGVYVCDVVIDNTAGDDAIPDDAGTDSDLQAEGGGKKYRGMMNIGTKPTIGEGLELTVEIYLLEFSGDLYGKRLTVSVLARVRDEKKFSGLEELRLQLERDKRASATFSERNGFFTQHQS